MFPREVANDSIITNMARDLNINFSIVGGRIEKYRETVMGFLIINVADKDVANIEKWLGENKMYWEVMKNGQ